MTFNTGNPIGSTDARDLSDNAENFDKALNSTAETWTDRLGVTRDTFEGRLAKGSFYRVGTFAAGYTLTNMRQTLEYNGNEYSWSGAFPKVVAPGTDPTAVTGYVSRTDVVLREQLAADDSPVLISGERASDIALRATGDDYTVIQSSAKFIEATIGSTTQYLECVITGDSLSFNAFGYPVGWATNGGGYATDNPFGLSSWSHIIRDLWVSSSNGFTPIDKVLVSTDTTQSYLSYTSVQHVGMNGKAVAFEFSTTSKKLAISAPGGGANISLIISYVPRADAVNFTVNGVPYSNETPDGHYLGYGYMIIPVFDTSATVTNVSKVVGGGAGFLIVYGAGGSSSGINIPKLTGKGAWTSGQILAEFSTLVAPYSPDIIFYIIGANDIVQNVPIATFRSNLVDFIDQARATKNPCEIVLISPPPSSSYTRLAAKSYIKVMRDVAVSKSCSLVDLYSRLEKTDPSYYRYDNIHFTAEGNNLVYSVIKELIFQGAPNVPSVFRQSAQCFAGVGGAFYKNRVGGLESISYVLNCTATNPTVTVNKPSWVLPDTANAVYSGSGVTSKVVFTPPSGYYVSAITPLAIDNTSTRKSIAMYVTNLNSEDVDLILMSSTGRIEIAGSDEYAIVTVNKLG